MATCPKCSAEIESLIFVTVFEQDVFIKTTKDGVRLIHDREQKVKHRYECPLCGKSIVNDKEEAKNILQ